MNFFNKSTFDKMKESSIFMNIGRGPTQHEADLIAALESKSIAGAVLDVFNKEPLDEKSVLWDMPNVLITPHCAQQDKDFMLDCVTQLGQNIDLFMSGQPLLNIADKKRGY